ncbi:MAG: hypothetical protein GXY50_02900 [Syntrophomonadaceae bacterium]|nr:hypothetical protein [Syntrophomonadaceae bacterium]
MRWGRLVLCGFLMVIMLCGGSLVFAANGDDRGSSEAPNLRIPGDRWMPVFKAGEKISLNVPIENTTSGTAKNLQVSLLVDDKFPFESERMTFTRYISSITDGTVVAGFNLTVPANIKPDVYPVNVSVSYDSDYGGGGQFSSTLYIKIENDFSQPQVKLMNVRLPGERLPAGKTSLVTLVLNNEGDLKVKDVEASLAGFNSGLTLDNWSDAQSLGQMEGKETKSASFRIHVDGDTKDGTYILDLKVTYKDDYNQEYEKETKVYLPVSGKGSQDDLVPRLIIGNYNYGSGEQTVAGQTFPLTISLINTSEQTAVKNVKLSLKSDGNVFTPIGSGNTLFIREIGAGGRADASISLKPKESAESQTFSVSADIEFQDEDGNKYTEQEIISIPVLQPLELLITEPVTPPEVFAGQSVHISLDFYNTGRAAVRNLRIHTIGDFDVSDGELYLGTVDSGGSDYYDVTLIPNQPGEVTGKIVFEYDDGGGQDYRMEKEFKLMVGEPMPMPNPDEMPMPMEGQSKMSFKWWMAAVPVILLAAIGFFIYRKKKRAKEALFLDE